MKAAALYCSVTVMICNNLIAFFSLAVQAASKTLMDSLNEIYESNWVGHDLLYVQAQNIEMLWQDFSHKLGDQVLIPLNTYQSQFPEMRVCNIARPATKISTAIRRTLSIVRGGYTLRFFGLTDILFLWPSEYVSLVCLLWKHTHCHHCPSAYLMGERMGKVIKLDSNPCM
jgi:formylmethanofuran dehydrogenase subunit E-like metal-binding protein